MSSGNLEQKLNEFRSGLSPLEADQYKLLLSLAAGNLINSTAKNEALSVALRTISAIRPPRILWRGRPEWMTNCLIHQLQDEAAAFSTTSSRNDFAWMHVGGPVATAVTFTPQLLHTFDPSELDYAPSGAMYVFYREPGDHVEPHVDEASNAVAAVLMIDHRYQASPSHLVLYSTDGSSERVLLAPGELILFDAATLVHAREPIGEGESVCVLTIGFHRKDSSPGPIS